ncbi:F-box/FBD/LRR-repeat protein At4g26340-like [Primulina eburnea]|uniref:F-box/FBD/LRR-repeat protein At4g26340-like n=1 Tax=Primulina eburnea TaxID=1245227 RepID=UPI003C6CA4E1
MDKTCSRQSQADSATQSPRKRKRKHKGADPLGVKRDSIGIDMLSDDMLVVILSYMSFKEAARTSLLSRRWRYLWMFTSGTLEFEDMDSATGSKIKWKKFKARVNRVLKLHQGPHVDSFIIRIRHAQPRHSRRALPRLRGVNSWIYFAMQKEVKRFNLDLQVRERFYSEYKFPSLEKLLSRTHEVKPAFGLLRSLELVHVDIEDEVVQYFLASCSYLEQLCIRASRVTKNLRVVDPLPNLRVMEISECYHIQSLEVSAMNLISFMYDGNDISLPFKKIPNVSELSLGGGFCQSFMCEPSKHSSYSVQLVTLALNVDIMFPPRMISAPRDLPQLHSLKRLELNVVSQVGRSLLFFATLVKASPFLHEFRIKVRYLVDLPWYTISSLMMFPEISAFAARFRHRHKNLKKFEVSGYIGCPSDEEFVLHLFKVAPSVEMVVIDTQSECYEQMLWDCSTMCNKEEGAQCFCQRDQMKLLEAKSGARTRVEAKERAKQLELSSPPKAVLVIT